jgi:hypothetical protein
MPGTPYPLGPFTAGMNNISEEATIDDNQVTLAKNLELDFDGSFKSRPAIRASYGTPVAGQQVEALGFYVREDNVTFLVATTDAKTWICQVDTGAWTEIWSSKAAGYAQYDNHIVLCSTVVPGIRWEAGTQTAIPNMPAGSDIILYQSRFWVYGVKGTDFQNRLWFSNITTAGTSPTSIWDWTTATDWIEVAKGDGEWITHVVADVNALLIFRNRSFYRFSFPGSPFDGSLFEQNSTIGADNRWSVVPYESYFLVFSQGYFYQLINYSFYPLNNKRIAFEGASTAQPVKPGREVRVSIFGPRCLVWYYGGLYVYNIITNTWSMWESPTTYAAQFFQIPQTSLAGITPAAFAVTGVTDTSKAGLYRIEDDVLDSAPGEPITCVLRTKSYAFDETAQHKRMFYWTFEIRSSNGGTGIAFPSAIPTDAVTYDDLDATTYDVLDLGSWDNPLILIPEYETDVPFPTAAPVRALIKAGQDSRLLRMYYEIAVECDGTAATSPARIYSIVPYVRIKGGVSKQVT